MNEILKKFKIHRSKKKVEKNINIMEKVLPRGKRIGRKKKERRKKIKKERRIFRYWKKFDMIVRYTKDTTLEMKGFTELERFSIEFIVF